MSTFVTALPDGLQRLSMDALPREPWRNGLGWTRTLAVSEDGQPRWRVSIAEIERASPFSRFDGLDRLAMLMAGGPLVLNGQRQTWPLSTIGDMACFPGETAISNTEPGQPALIWNVMVCRGEVETSVGCIHGQPWAMPDGGHSLVWVLRGQYEWHAQSLPSGLLLEDGEGLHWQGYGAGPTLSPTSTDACLLYTYLRTLGTP